jgi:hypothetical protein
MTFFTGSSVFGSLILNEWEVVQYLSTDSIIRLRIQLRVQDYAPHSTKYMCDGRYPSQSDGFYRVG